MTIIATFLGNAALNFAIGLLVARFLGPKEFGRYAVAMAIAVVVNTVLFEWLRLAAIRFYSERSRRVEPAIRATLEAGFAAMAVALAVLVGLDLLLGVGVSGLSPPLVVAAAASAVSVGFLEYHGALARARFASGTYARLIGAKNALYLALMVGGAFWFRDAAAVVAGSALGALGAVALVRASLREGEGGAGPAPHPQPAAARMFLAYAVPIVAATALYQLIPLMNRSWLAARDGFAEAGYFALAADLATRLFGTVGSALDMLLFQHAVRTDETSGRAEAERQVARNLALVAAVLLPSAAGFWAVLPALEALVVPAAYRGSFAGYAEILLPAVLAIGLVQYALNPVFQLRQRTAPVILAALAGLAVDVAALFLVPERLGPRPAAAAQVAGLVAALGVLGALALTGRNRLRLPWRDLGATAAASALMTAAIAPLRGIEPAGLALAASTLLGGAVYLGLAWMFDIAGLRDLARGAWRRSAPTPAE